ncbi:MAG: adenylate/guanylate cyclase domain-containing protein [Xanthomonadales bacterium]|nr:adenylate/guanylate cyclase domain-containing protein [Xanthomonadales bacterium]
MLFADVSGSTALYERIGDALAAEAMDNILKALVDRAVAERGRLIKSIGDEVMLLFPHTDHAIRAAIAMQEFVAQPNGDPDAMGLRVGLCSGPMEHRARDVFGDTVNTAARLTSLARRGSITTDRATLNSMRSTVPGFRSIGWHALAGKQAPVECIEILWSSEGLTAAEDVRRPLLRRSLLLRHDGTEVMLQSSDRATIGRDPDCDLVVADERVSGRHAVITGSAGNFVLVDTSTNGTTLLIPGQPTITLRRERTILVGLGRLVLGVPGENDRTISFETREG